MFRWLLCVAICWCAWMPAQASIQFYTDKAAFDAAASTTLVDFEGIVAPGDFGYPGSGSNQLTSSIALSGVSFTSVGSLAIAGVSAASVQGSPYDSDLLFAVNTGAPLIAALPGGVTAVGGFFGSILDADHTTTLTLVGAGGVLDTRTLAAADMGAGTPSNFFGWTVTGDTIVSLRHEVAGSFTGLDNFQFGTATPPANIPEPSSLIAWLGLACAAVGKRASLRSSM